ncbi:hypothetical protein S7335_1995 [Synechococcus sp. PCC 7335]|uniref:hypothetical protein n=1 Tax=Synechococcus sp. (strain ATCC 29403 / PCC 7335) TaxID=91464 RepID=UPI00017ECAA6|nr:hypothetical protein [Synechococcus sp. PCC 7335]EDX84298.1 hypothetical protein S7335_1995 [Synechococcus sp. PCC 7335]
MRKALVGLMGLGVVLGLGMSVGVRDAIAQDSGVANTAEDFKSGDAGDGILGSNVDIWDIFHRSSVLSGAGVTDEGFYRSQSRRINREAESLRERQRAIIEQQNGAEQQNNIIPETGE